MNSSNPRPWPPLGRWLLPGAVLALALGALSCAQVPNFTDPSGPGMVVQYASAKADTARNDEIRIVTFNVKFAEKVEEAIELLRENPRLRDADIVALQEMDDTAVDRMAKALGMNAVYYAASLHPSNQKNFGPALLTPWPVERGWKVILPYEGHFRGQRRTATGAQIRVGDRSLRVYSTHLETPFRLGGSKRQGQVQAILEDAAEWNGPMLVAGDMNDEGIVSYFEKNAFVWANCDAGPSLGPLSYDHIFLRGFAVHGQRPPCGVEDPRGSSDHRPVWVCASFQ